MRSLPSNCLGSTRVRKILKTSSLPKLSVHFVLTAQAQVSLKIVQTREISGSLYQNAPWSIQHLPCNLAVAIPVLLRAGLLKIAPRARILFALIVNFSEA